MGTKLNAKIVWKLEHKHTHTPKSLNELKKLSFIEPHFGLELVYHVVSYVDIDFDHTAHKIHG